MSDSAQEDKKTDSPQEGTENTAATNDATNAKKTSVKADEEPGAAAGILLMVWSAFMIICTTILSFYAFVLKDESAVPFVVLGIIGLCLPQIVSFFRTMSRNKRIMEEYDEKIRKAEIERIKQVREREKERLEQERIFAEKEAAEQAAIGNVDVQAYKINH